MKGSQRPQVNCNSEQVIQAGDGGERLVPEWRGGGDGASGGRGTPRTGVWRGVASGVVTKKVPTGYERQGRRHALDPTPCSRHAYPKGPRRPPKPFHRHYHPALRWPK